MLISKLFAKLLIGTLFCRMQFTPLLTMVFRRSVLLAAVVLFLPLASAQQNQRNVFPGRRVGGGTRGECSARVLAHLVPETSVFSPAPTGDLALVRGPSAQPVPLAVTFRAQRGEAEEDLRRMPARPAGITLLRVPPIREAMVWESAFACESDDSTTADDLSFVETASPPALSLLVAVSEPGDLPVQQALAGLRQQCGASVPTAETLASFGLADLATAQWPKHLPVDCPDSAR